MVCLQKLPASVILVITCEVADSTCRGPEREICCILNATPPQNMTLLRRRSKINGCQWLATNLRCPHGLEMSERRTVFLPCSCRAQERIRVYMLHIRNKASGIGITHHCPIEVFLCIQSSISHAFANRAVLHDVRLQGGEQRTCLTSDSEGESNAHANVRLSH